MPLCWAMDKMKHYLTNFIHSADILKKGGGGLCKEANSAAKDSQWDNFLVVLARVPVLFMLTDFKE